MLAVIRSSALLLLCPLAQDAIERGTPWYWPVGDFFGPGRIRQGHGQYETASYVVPAGFDLYQVYAAHQGLDVAAEDDEFVRAPIAGTVLGIRCPATSCPEGSVTTTDPNGSVILGADTGDWGLTVTHLYDISVLVDDHVEKGEILGRAVTWSALPTFTHVHLGLFSPKPDDAYANKIYVGDPLVFLGGRSDTRAPSLLDIDDGTESYWPVAFVDDVTPATALTFHAPDALPQQELDILAHVNDYFTTLELSAPFLGSFTGILIVTPIELVPLELSLTPFPLRISKVAPARLSVRITRAASGVEVFQSTVEFDRQVSDAAYLEPSDAVVGLASAGWPDPDFYFLLTHSETATGSWDTSDATAGGAGKYTVEVTAEDAAGNIVYASIDVEVSP